MGRPERFEPSKELFSLERDIPVRDQNLMGVRFDNFIRYNSYGLESSLLNTMRCLIRLHFPYNVSLYFLNYECQRKISLWDIHNDAGGEVKIFSRRLSSVD